MKLMPTSGVGEDSLYTRNKGSQNVDYWIEQAFTLYKEQKESGCTAYTVELLKVVVNTTTVLSL